MEDEYDIKRKMEKKIEGYEKKIKAYENKLGNYCIMSCSCVDL